MSRAHVRLSRIKKARKDWHTPLTRSSIPMHSDRQRMSTASARACCSGDSGTSGFSGRAVFTVMGVSGTVVSPSSATLVSLYRRSMNQRIHIVGSTATDNRLVLVLGIVEFMYHFYHNTDKVTFIWRQLAQYI